jgi:transposase-like protein
MKDPALKDKFVELRAQGVSFAAIAERLGVAKSTLIGWNKERENDVGNLQQIYTKTLREKYRMGAERRSSSLPSNLIPSRRSLQSAI